MHYGFIIFHPLKIAIFEGLYVLFRELLPRPGQRTAEKPIDDIDVFEFSTHCWAYLITASEVRFVILVVDLVLILFSSNMSIGMPEIHQSIDCD